MNKEIFLDYKFPYDGLISENLLHKAKEEKKGKKKKKNQMGHPNNMPKIGCGKNGVQI